MISLTRDRTNAAIHGNFKVPKKVQFEQELLEDQREIRKGNKEKHDFNSERWQKSKDQLKKETHDKCAYCEAPTSLVAYGDVEHYRPKSVYWWLAYNYDNYLVSCQLCNQKFKKAKFPVRNTRLKAPTVTKNSTDTHLKNLAGTLGPDPLDSAQVQAFKALHIAERPLLLNPYFDKPSNTYAWHADDTLKEVELVAIEGNADSKDFVKAAHDHYGLNRPELRTARYQIYATFMAFKEIAADPDLSAGSLAIAQTQMTNMMADDAPFAGMLRYFDIHPDA